MLVAAIRCKGASYRGPVINDMLDIVPLECISRRKYRQNKEALGRKSTRTLPVSYPKMALQRH